MSCQRLAVIAVVLFEIMSSAALAQALPNVSSLRLNYNVRKRSVEPKGELKTKIDEVDRDLAEATRLGQVGEVRRQLAKGQTLLGGGQWTPDLDFRNSLVLRADRVFVDSSQPFAVRIEQLYSPAIRLERPLVAKASLRRADGGARGGRGGAAGGGAAGGGAAVVKDLGTLDEVGRDLREAPYFVDVDLAGLADGAYQVHVDVLDGQRLLGTTSLRIVARKGLDAELARLEADAARAAEAFRADVSYPVAFVRDVNRGKIAIGSFDLTRESETARKNLALAEAGKDPFAGRTGDFKRHYLLKEAGEILPYRMFVPAGYDGTKAYPLVVALHGLGGSEDSMFSAGNRVIVEATKRNYIVVAPLGYRVDGGYGGRPGAETTRKQQLSEADVMQVLARVQRDFKIDENRTYLMGHSMGAGGTWSLGAKHPAIWAALAPIAGGGNPASMERMKHIPQIVVHGDADNVANVSASRTMVARARELGVDIKYIEVAGGSHSNVVGPNMAAIFDFFDGHRKGQASAAAK